MSTDKIRDSDLVQLYDTTIASSGSDLATRFLVIPKRSLSDKQVLNSWSDLAARLELSVLERSSDVSVPRFALTSILLDEYADPAHLRFRALLRGESPHAPLAVDQFVERLTADNLIPFEESPLAAMSLLDIAKMVAGGGTGAIIGLVAAGPTPLLLITVPLGIVLCGAAPGVGKALGVGLGYRLLKLMGLSDSQALKIASAERGKTSKAGAA